MVVWCLAGCEQELQVFAVADAAFDASTGDAGSRDGGPRAEDAGVDAGADSDAGADTGLDAEVDAGPPSGAFAVGAGEEHSCAILGGPLFCWGSGNNGRLGTGSAEASPSPVPVGLAADWEALSVGAEHTCGIRRGGALYCWGANDSGQLGQGDLVDRFEPAPVSGGPWTGVSAGEAHTCALEEGGALWCWGENFEGQLGQDDPFGSPDLTDPSPVLRGTTFRDVGAGEGHTCALRGDGALSVGGATPNHS